MADSPNDPTPTPPQADPQQAVDAAAQAAARLADQAGGQAGQSAADEALRAAMQAVNELQGQVAGAVHASGPKPNAGEGGAQGAIPPDARPFTPPVLEFAPDSPEARAIDVLGDVNLNVKIELGRTRMLVEDVLKLAEGAVVELEKLAGDPVDVYVNDRHVARGEVLVLNDNFCVRISEVLTPTKDIPPGSPSP